MADPTQPGSKNFDPDPSLICSNFYPRLEKNQQGPPRQGKSKLDFCEGDFEYSSPESILHTIIIVK